MEFIEILIIILGVPLVIISSVAILKGSGIIGRNKNKTTQMKEIAATYEIIINRYKNEIKSLNGKLFQMRQHLEADDDNQQTPMITLDMLKPQLSKFGINPEMLDNPIIAQMANDFIKKPSIQKQIAALAAIPTSQTYNNKDVFMEA